MTNAIESEDLTRAGPGSAMGEPTRQYWIPAAKSSEVPGEGDPLRLMLLGEKEKLKHVIRPLQTRNAVE